MNRAGLAGATAEPAAGGRGGSRAFHAMFSPVWIAFVAFQWWLDIRRHLTDVLPAGAAGTSADVAAAMGAIGHLASNAVEALFYVAFWRARGARPGFARLFEWLVTLSVLDLLSSGLARFAEAHPGWIASALEVFVGFGVLGDVQPAEASGVRIAFGSVGLLCIARLVGTAAVQSRATGSRLAAPFALTVTVWLVGRLANWWLSDLARGMSSRF